MMIDGRPALTMTNAAEILLVSVMSESAEQQRALERPGWTGI